jgi:predicted ATPase
MHYTAKVEFEPGLKLVSELDALARATDDSYAFIVARNVENMTYGWMGNFVRACDAARRGVQAYEPERHAPLVRIYNHDQKCGILSWYLHFLWFLGYPDQAQEAAQEQVDLARRLGHPFNLAFSLTTGCAALVLRGDYARAKGWIDEAERIGVDNAMLYMTRYFVPFWRGISHITQGLYADGYEHVTSGWEFMSSGGGSLLAPYAYAMRGAALSNMDRSKEARSLFTEALDFVDRTNHRMHEAEVHRALGTFHVRLSEPEPAERSYHKAIAVARSQQAKGWELRAAIDLGRLWRDQGKRHEAFGLLAPIYDWFTEGLHTRDLQQAATLLAEVG